MIRYQTEVVVAPDRYVCLQLPDHLPEGRARVTVVIEEPEPVEVAVGLDSDLDHQDIEWWEEFEEGPERVEGR